MGIFKKKLNLDLEVLSASVSKQSSLYVFETMKKKYNTVRNLFIEKNCLTIIYVSLNKKAQISRKINTGWVYSKPYHGHG
jgi:hypothetical protein